MSRSRRALLALSFVAAFAVGALVGLLVTGGRLVDSARADLGS